MSDLRQLVKTVRKQGGEVERTRDHWAVRKGGRQIVVLPLGLTDRGGACLVSTKASLRRAGFQV